MSQQITISTSEQIVQVTLNESGEPIRAVLRENAIIIQKGGTRVGTVNAINFIEGSNITLTYTNDADGVTGNLTITGAAGGSGDLLAANNLSDVANVATALSNLGGQPLDSDLTAIAALTTTSYGRAFLALANAAAARTAIGERIYVFDKTVTPVSVTGTAAETLLYSVLVPANTFQVGDIIRIMARWTKSGTSNVADARVRINTSSSLSGATLVANTTISAAQSYGAIERNILLDTISSQSVYNTSGNQGTDAQSTNTGDTLSIDFSLDQYIIFSGDLISLTDTHTFKWAYIQIIR